MRAARGGRHRPVRTSTVGIMVTATVLLVAAMAVVMVQQLVSRDDAAPEPTARPQVTTSEPTPTENPSAEPEPDPEPRSPFTGQRMKKPGPVLGIKIDNVVQARPHTGVEEADIVYVEPVEAGLSRLLAIFSSSFPDRLGPVRSARESDLDILRQYGTPGLVFSGANTTVLGLIADARVHDLEHGSHPEAYERDEQRVAPHNLYTRPADLLERAPDVSRASDIGFRFGAAPDGGRRLEPDEVPEVQYTAFRIGFSWSAKEKRWLIEMDGEPYVTTGDGPRPSAATVVIQRVVIRDSDHRQMREVGSPYLETVGSGTATVLRNGRAFEAEWSRPDADSGTTFTTADGDPMPFARGPVWVVFAPAA